MNPNLTTNYSSHHPILKEFGARHDILKVIEFGVGKYSTSLFLDNAVYPHLVSLVSVESEPMWCLWVKNRYEKDIRFTLIEADEFSQMQIDFHGPYDLCFVDSMNTGMRLVTLAKMRLQARFLVLHDAEVAAYDKVIPTFKYSRIYKPKDGVPWTAVLSNFEEVK